MSNISPAIRKAAVLVSALDERAADLLLEQMGADMSGKVRYALMMLDDITLAEQQRVLNDFFARSTTVPVARDAHPHDDAQPDNGVELELSSSIHAADTPSADVGDARDHSGNSEPHDDELLALLKSASPSDLAQVLEREQPQTIAVVVARLDPATAAQIFEKLPSSLATEALARLAWLGDPAPEALAEIARHLQSQLAARAQRQPAIAAVRALLDATNLSRRGVYLEALAGRDPRLANQLRQSLGQETGQSYRAESHGYRIERSAAAIGSPAGPVSLPLAERFHEVSHIEFDDLQRLDDTTLRQIFAAADPQIVLLALTGSDEGFLARILRQLPPREAAILRNRLSHPGALRLSDIRQAQEQLLLVARRLAADGTIVLPPTRHFAAAA